MGKMFVAAATTTAATAAVVVFLSNQKKTGKGNHKSASAEEAKTARSRMGKEDETGITTNIQTHSHTNTHMHIHSQISSPGRKGKGMR